jgi:hypothetical protein
MSPIRYAHGDEPTGYSLPLLYNLVYCSRATVDVDEASVTRIIESARRHNPAHGITGILVFGSGVFFQWLEGPRDNVTQLMTMLHADPRHTNLVTLSESEELRERVFPDWDMELVSAADIHEVLVDALSTAEDASSREALQGLLRRIES